MREYLAYHRHTAHHIAHCPVLPRAGLQLPHHAMLFGKNFSKRNPEQRHLPQMVRDNAD